MRSNLNIIGGIVLLSLLAIPIVINEINAKDAVESFINGKYAYLGMSVACIVYGSVVWLFRPVALLFSKDKSKVNGTVFEGVFIIAIGAFMLAASLMM